MLTTTSPITIKSPIPSPQSQPAAVEVAESISIETKQNEVIIEQIQLSPVAVTKPVATVMPEIRMESFKVRFLSKKKKKKLN